MRRRMLLLSPRAGLALARDRLDELPHRLVGPELRVGVDAAVALGAHLGLDLLALAEAVPELLDLVGAHRNHGGRFYKERMRKKRRAARARLGWGAARTTSASSRPTQTWSRCSC